MDEQLIKELVLEARDASSAAYAPYSQFSVGSVIVLKNGERVRGANIENASYPITICAERVAMSQVIMKGQADNVAMVIVVTDTEKPGTPCGMCRQFLSEFIAADTPIICGNSEGEYFIATMGTLLPFSFTKNMLLHS